MARDRFANAWVYLVPALDRCNTAFVLGYKQTKPDLPVLVWLIVWPIANNWVLTDWDLFYQSGIHL